jgi:hypothetical protein
MIAAQTNLLLYTGSKLRDSAVANAGLLLPATLAQRLGIEAWFEAPSVFTKLSRASGPPRAVLRPARLGSPMR